jgi:hypothetical protein
MSLVAGMILFVRARSSSSRHPFEAVAELEARLLAREG